MMFSTSDNSFSGPNNRITVWLEDKQQSMEVNASVIEVTILTTVVIVILIWAIFLRLQKTQWSPLYQNI